MARYFIFINGTDDLYFYKFEDNFLASPCDIELSDIIKYYPNLAFCLKFIEKNKCIEVMDNIINKLGIDFNDCPYEYSRQWMIEDNIFISSLDKYKIIQYNSEQ